ncbi:hypothetical protein K504DRAFT_392348 [Pleomassaria siparia CBS 279.74]|uniref:Uncharacterized protein n=1 Tax=Pleomassaria siparia CBS 279.74 TaxID=1314801 RepID=A0A6G1JTD4_9PLEO|nr:hypothetical protein K504DRAFT_392348 [Pleomassaria siparia CBS 279.74]
MSREPASPTNAHPHVSGLHLPRIAIQPEPRRYPGDGFDYRRPVSMQRQEEQAAVIDLTADDAGPSTSNGTNSRRTTARTQRPPRFAREIIDLVDEDSGRPTAHSESPEIQFISSRALSPPRRLNQHNGNSDQDDVEFVAENRLPVERRRGHLRNMMADVFDDLERERDPIHFNQFNHLRARLQEVVNNGHPPIIPRRAGGQDRREGRIRLGFVAPTMNFEMVGFDMGFGAGPVVPPPVYDKPEAAPEGFTRSPEEDDTIICPNCRDDLCLGDSDLKKQVWIVKGCGHVYCGECTANRSLKKSAKGKERAAGRPRPPAFKSCVVEGCEKRTVSPKSMIQIFL